MSGLGYSMMFGISIHAPARGATANKRNFTDGITIYLYILCNFQKQPYNYFQKSNNYVKIFGAKDPAISCLLPFRTWVKPSEPPRLHNFLWLRNAPPWFRNDYPDSRI